MRGMTLLRNALCISAMTFALGSAANAAAGRTFVSGVGNDANTASNCARANPCRSLQAAFSVTSLPDGEIDAVDAAGYGAISTTITGTLTILGVPGAAISVPGGGTGITINASGSTVVIDSIQINGQESGTNTGITLTAGNLVLRNSVVKLLATGLFVGNGSATAHADVDSTDFIGNTIGIETNGAGVPWNSGAELYLTSACPCKSLVRINGGNYVDNTTVFQEENPTTVSSQPTATFWGTTFVATGFTTLITSTGTGGVSGQPPVQNSSPFPN
jgi:hypothetical protein